MGCVRGDNRWLLRDAGRSGAGPQADARQLLDYGQLERSRCFAGGFRSLHPPNSSYMLYCRQFSPGLLMFPYSATSTRSNSCSTGQGD